MDSVQGRELDRREVLRRLAAAGAVGWASPMIISSPASAAGVFTAKCAPGVVTAGAPSFSQTGCTGTGTTITVTITFAGPCRCGGVSTWCVQKNSPGGVVSSTTPTISFSVSV
ncbi:MAG: hypothetical protein ABJ382_00915, partial [Ilumatobacter sp.]